MSRSFEELDYQQTPMGPVSLRRRLSPTLGIDVFEVLLGDEFLMSSLFTVGERALATLSLARANGPALDVLVGGLGLGYTAAAALADPRVRSVTVVDALDAVIDWHRRGLVPLGAALSGDPRCRLVSGDFFDMAVASSDSGPDGFDVILLDIDHSPDALLNPRHAGFYSRQGLARLAARLRPGGVFGMWSDAAPDPAFQALLAGAFATSEAHVVEFDNLLGDGKASCTIYVASEACAAPA